MITVKENTTIVGLSELRTKMDKILELAKNYKVLIERRNKPLAVLLDIDKYNEMEKILDALEDVALGYLAKEREAGSKSSNYIDIEKIEREIKLL